MQGRFVPKNPQKYLGDVRRIFFRSSWELYALKFFDTSTAVVRYASEEIAIPYVSPKDGRVHRYYPDFIAKIMDASGTMKTYILEIKPLKESSEEYAKSPHDIQALIINKAKWAAATHFASTNNMEFKVLTELDLYKLMPPKVKKPRAAKKPSSKTEKPKKSKVAKAPRKKSITTRGTH